MSPITVKTVYGGDAESGHYSGAGAKKSRAMEPEGARVIAIVVAVLAYFSSLHCKEAIPKNLKKYSKKRNSAATVPISTFMSVSDLYIPTIDLPILVQKICGPINIKIAHRHMNVEIGTEAAQFPEKEYIKGIFVAVYSPCPCRKETRRRVTVDVVFKL